MERTSYVLQLVNAGVHPDAAERRATALYGPPTKDPRVAEKEEQAEVVKRFRAFGFRVYNLSQARATKQTPGLPDLWCAHTTAPVAFWWETKRQVGGKHSPSQEDFRAECYRCCVGYGTGDRHAAEAHLILLALAYRSPSGTLEPTSDIDRANAHL